MNYDQLKIAAEQFVAAHGDGNVGTLLDYFKDIFSEALDEPAAAPQSGPITDAEQADLYRFCEGTPHYAVVRQLYRAASQATEQPHSDHPLRHYDRTCPACVDDQPADRAQREELRDAAESALAAYQHRFGSVAPPLGNYIGPIDEEMIALRAALARKGD